jgi:DNA repair protein RadA/Sms
MTTTPRMSPGPAPGTRPKAARVRTVYRCGACEVEAAQWLGRCAGCGEWGTLEAVQIVAAGPNAATPVDHLAMGVACPIAEVDPSGAAPVPTGVGELDRVLGGGLVPGSVTLVGGEPGIGKSTLVLQLLAGLARDVAPVLLVTAEESTAQVRARAERLGALAPGLHVVAATAVPHVLAHIATVAPSVVAVDSIQTVMDPETSGTPGSVAQVRECARRLVQVAKTADVPVLLVGHVTKDGTIAGPRSLEHVVDTVLSFEGDRHQTLRHVRALKHRFGSTQEVGLLEMTPAGLVAVADPSATFLAGRRSDAPGSVVVPALDGVRPMLVEVQALVTANETAGPRRHANGVDATRLAVVTAVLEQRAGVVLGGRDVHVSVAGGVRVTEPGADLGIALAVVGARLGRVVHDDLVVLGELGLGGEVRTVAGTTRRLAEAARLGFRRAVVPMPGLDERGLHDVEIELVAVRDLREAVTRALA